MDGADASVVHIIELWNIVFVRHAVRLTAVIVNEQVDKQDRIQNANAYF